MKLITSGLLIASAAIVAAATPSSRLNAVDITRTHGFKDARACSFRSKGEGLFNGLGSLRYKQSLRLTRQIGGIDLALNGRRTSRPDPSGGSDDEGATVGTPVRPVRFHGLPVRSFATGFFSPAESDLQYWREVRLNASPAEVRGILARLGVRVPARGYYSINDDHPCGGALSVKGKAGKTSIRCEWGC